MLTDHRASFVMLNAALPWSWIDQSRAGRGASPWRPARLSKLAIFVKVRGYLEWGGRTQGRQSHGSPFLFVTSGSGRDAQKGGQIGLGSAACGVGLPDFRV